MANSVLYLESYIDSTTSLPADFQRTLTTIKRLDEQSHDILQRLQHNMQLCQDLPPLHTMRKVRAWRIVQ